MSLLTQKVIDNFKCSFMHLFQASNDRSHGIINLCELVVKLLSRDRFKVESNINGFIMLPAANHVTVKSDLTI